MRLVVFLFLLAACATGQTPAQKVFAIQGVYNAGLATAVAYKRLPPCPTVVVCSKPEVIKQLQEADDIAAPSLLAAQNIVRHPELGGSEKAIVAANEAVRILTAITARLVVKESQ